MRIAIVGHQTAYSRTRVLRQALTEYTHITLDLVDINGDSMRTVRRQFRMFRSAMVQRRNADIYLLPALNQKEILALWSASCLTGKPLVTDMLISTYDTLVGDRQLLSPSSPKARIARYLDRMACSKSSLLLCDTEAHVAYFVTEYGADPLRCAVVRVGAEAMFFAHDKPSYSLQHSGRMKVLFYGSFSPLHGIPAILEAADLLDPKRFEFSLIGAGQVWDQINSRVAEAGLQHVTLEPPMPYMQLPRLIRSFDVGLGIFGASAKANRVVPNKAYQMAACGLPVVTADTPAIKEVFEPDRSIVTVSDVTGEGIASALLRLYGSQEYRRDIGMRGREAVERLGHPKAIAQQLLDAFRRADFWYQ